MEAEHHGDPALGRPIGIGTVQGASADDHAVAGFHGRWHGVGQAFGDGRELATVGKPPAPVAPGDDPEAVLGCAVGPGHGKVEAVGLAGPVRLLQRDAVVRPVRAPILVPACRRAFAGTLVEDALVKRHEVRPVDARDHAQDFRMAVNAQRRVHHHQGVRDQADHRTLGAVVAAAVAIIVGRHRVVTGEFDGRTVLVELAVRLDRGIVQDGIEFTRQVVDLVLRQDAGEDVETVAEVGVEDVLCQPAAVVESHGATVAELRRPLEGGRAVGLPVGRRRIVTRRLLRCHAHPRCRLLEDLA